MVASVTNASRVSGTSLIVSSVSATDIRKTVTPVLENVLLVKILPPATIATSVLKDTTEIRC